MNLQKDATLHVKGKLVRIHVGEHIPIENQFVALQLGDGQTIETNVRNLAENVGAVSAKAVDVAKEIEQMRAQYAQATKALDVSRSEVFALHGEISALKELLQSAEARARQVEAARTNKKRG